jgi:hypothetical protein
LDPSLFPPSAVAWRKITRVNAGGCRVARWYICKPKIPIWVNFTSLAMWRVWLILGPIGHFVCIIYGHLVKLLVKWYIFPVLISIAEKNLATLGGCRCWAKLRNRNLHAYVGSKQDNDFKCLRPIRRTVTSTKVIYIQSQVPTPLIYSHNYLHQSQVPTPLIYSHKYIRH